MLKKYYDIDEYFEERAMKEESWGWKLWFTNSWDKTYVDINIITTTGWYIDKNYNQISAKELINIGLENLESYFTAKKYNL
jgi:hypothetical protein